MFVWNWNTPREELRSSVSSLTNPDDQETHSLMAPKGEMGASLGIYAPRQQITLQPRTIAVDKKSGSPRKPSGKSVGFQEDNENLDSRKENDPLIQRENEEFRDINDQGSVTPDSNRNFKTSRTKRVTLNVSGFKYQTYAETLHRFPETLLGNPAKRREYYDHELREYFFDRNKQVFEIILYFYQSNGRLVCPPDLAPEILLEEVEFFELGEIAVNAVKELLTDEEAEDPPRELPENKIQRQLWNLFEYPESGKAARILALFSVSIIVASIVILCTETLPNFHVIPDSKITDPNDTAEVERVREHNEFASTGKLWFSNLEAAFIAWFTLEYLVRFFTSPKKLAFVRSFLNVIDILAIVPFYIDLILNSVIKDSEKLSLAFLRILRLVRVFRIFKLSRHSSGLQILGLTLKKSLRELGLLVFFLVIGVVIFSSMAYYAEAGEPDTDLGRSIPETFWWALVTMTTVGYGDLVPKTLWGKLVGSCCALCGVLAIALPVPVIVSNFDAIYKKHRSRKIKQGGPEEEDSKKISIMVSSASTSSFNEDESPTITRKLNKEEPLLDEKHNDKDPPENKPISNGKFKNRNEDPPETLYEEEIEMEPIDSSNSPKPTGVETTL